MFDQLFHRASRIVTGSQALFRAEAEIAAARLRTSVTGAIALGTGVFIMAVALAGGLVAGTAALSLVLGWIASLAIASGVVLLLGLAILLGARAWMNRELHPPASDEDAQQQVYLAKQEIRAAATPDPNGSPVHHNGVNWKEQAMHVVMNHPAAVAGAAFAALALFGPMRCVRLLSRGIAATGIASAALSAKHAVDAENRARPRTRSTIHYPPSGTDFRSRSGTAARH